MLKQVLVVLMIMKWFWFFSFNDLPSNELWPTSSNTVLVFMNSFRSWYSRLFLFFVPRIYIMCDRVMFLKP